MNSIKLIELTKLRYHEQVDKDHVNELVNQINQDGYIKNPIIVDDKHHIILDGHHRTQALRQLGAKLIPVYMVNYFDHNIKVYLRRKILLNQPIKQAVVSYGLQSKLFPSKTTRHLIYNRPKNINIKITHLFNNY